jgi:hypothetical protein
MTESARASYGTRRWVGRSSGKSPGQARSDRETIGSATAAATSSSEAAVARAADARTLATIAATAPSSSPFPSLWIGATGTPGSTSAMRRRSTTR